jgi:hypothetical protein
MALTNAFGALALDASLTQSQATAGTEATKVTSVQGSASGIPFKVTAADGSVVTLGTLTDTAASTASGSFTLMAVSKGILAQTLTNTTTLTGILNKLNATVAISATSLPLPTGAATASNQATANTSLSSILTALNGTVAVSAVSLPIPTGASTEATLVAVSNKLSGTLAVSATALPLPTGAATAAGQATAQTSLTTIASLAASYPASPWSSFATGIDMRAYSNITIMCTTTPTTAGLVQISDDGTTNWRYVALLDQFGNLANATTGNPVSTAGYDYSLFVGKVFVRILGETGGVYQIKGYN